MKSVQKDGLEYEFAIVLDIDIKHNATSSKDRTGLFSDKPAFKITVETGKKIKEWCNSVINEVDIKTQIDACNTIDELVSLYKKYSTWYEKLYIDFNKRKQDLTVKQQLTHPQNFSANGTTTH